MKCPQRMLDHAEVDSWRSDKTCSYCGSLNPDEFMNLVRSGARVGPTDKSYKAYVNGHTKFYFQHLSEDQRKELVKLVNEGAVQFEYPGYFYVLPFFMKFGE